MSTDLNKNIMAERLNSAEGKQRGFISRHANLLAGGSLLVGVASTLYGFGEVVSASVQNPSSPWTPVIAAAGLIGAAAFAIYSHHQDLKFNQVLADPLKFWDRTQEVKFDTVNNMDDGTLNVPGIGHLSKNEIDFFSLPELKEITNSMNIDISKETDLKKMLESTRHGSHIEELFGANKKDVEALTLKVLSNVSDKEMAIDLKQKLFGRELNIDIPNNRNEQSKAQLLELSNL